MNIIKTFELIAVNVVILFLSLILFSCSADNSPEKQDIANYLAEQIPPHYSLKNFTIEAKENIGTKVIPIWQHRFTGTLENNQALYKVVKQSFPLTNFNVMQKRDIEQEETRRTKFIEEAAASGTIQIPIYGIVTATLESERWVFSDATEEPDIPEYLPRNKYISHMGNAPVEVGSTDEAKLRSRISQKIEQRNAEDIEKIVSNAIIGDWGIAKEWTGDRTPTSMGKWESTNRWDHSGIDFIRFTGPNNYISATKNNKYSDDTPVTFVNGTYEIIFDNDINITVLTLTPDDASHFRRELYVHWDKPYVVFIGSPKDTYPWRQSSYSTLGATNYFDEHMPVFKLISLNDGSLFEGTFLGEKREGIGTTVLPNGMKTICNYKNDTLHGTCTTTMPDNIRMTIEFKNDNGVLNPEGGVGYIHFPDGFTYDGRMTEAIMPSPSALNFDFNRLLQANGEYRDGEIISGFGYLDGYENIAYLGYVSGGKPDGLGIGVWPDGKYYKGLWKTGKPHGNGIIFNGTVKSNVQFKDGKRIY